MKRVIKGVHIVPMGFANAFLIEGDDGLALIDAGYPGKESAVFGAIHGLGRSPDQLKHLVFTHAHPDHIGSAAAIVRGTGARTYMHPLDIPIAESGGPFRPMTPAPGLLGRVLCNLFFHPDERLDPVAIDQPLSPGETLPVAGGFEVIHVPGHCAGQVALLWHPGRMLFAADVCTNIMGLGDPVGFENLEEGRASQCKLASLSFDAAEFGHGKPIARDASTRFRNEYAKHPEEVHQHGFRSLIPRPRRPVGRLFLSKTLQLFLVPRVYSSPVRGQSNKPRAPNFESSAMRKVGVAGSLNSGLPVRTRPLARRMLPRV